MSDRLRDAAVQVLDRRDAAVGVKAIPADLSIAVEVLRDAVLADKDERDALAAALADAAAGPLLSIPTEPLHLTRQFAALTRSQWRLFGAIHIAAHHFGGLTALMASAQHVEIAAKAVKLADRVLRANDEFDGARPAAVPAAKCVREAPVKADLDRYLRWLADRDGSCLTTEHPPTLDPQLAADCRRHLLKLGLLAATHKGGSLTATGYTLTAHGWNAVDPLPRPADAVRLSGQEDAA